MLRRRSKRALWLVSFETGRGLEARWEWRWWIASHCAVNGVRDWLRTHRIHGWAPNNSKQDPRLKDESLTRRGSTELLEFPHLFISLRRNWGAPFRHASQERTVADIPSISMHWNARAYNSSKTREFTFHGSPWKKIQMEVDRHFWQSCDWQLSFVRGDFEHGYRSINFGQKLLHI